MYIFTNNSSKTTTKKLRGGDASAFCDICDCHGHDTMNCKMKAIIDKYNSKKSAMRCYVNNNSSSMSACFALEAVEDKEQGKLFAEFFD